MSTKSVSELIEAYIKIRDRRSELEAERTKLAEIMDRIEQELRTRAAAEGVEGFKTAHGSTYNTVTLKASIADWGVFSRWMVENDALDFVERRVRSKEVEAFLEANGDTPPGVTTSREIATRIRRS